MLLGIQILGALFSLFMLYFTFLHYKRNEIKQSEYIVWIIIWVCFIIISFFPWFLDPFTKTLNLQRTMDLFILCGFMILIGFMFHNYISLKKTQKKLEDIVRNIAMDKTKSLKK
jgi:hypothetical protein